MNSRKIAVLIGTRPGIVKMTPIVHQLKRMGLEPLVIHTGQHYSEAMDAQIMRDVGLASPTYQITRPPDCISHAEQTAYMLTNIEAVLLRELPEILLVCGDANTNLSGALAARKIHVNVGHVESGLRSFDWRMPEEHNRVIIDHISDYLFAPTQLAKKHLLNDGVSGAIFVVGNTIVDATLDGLARSRERSDFSSFDRPFFLLTLHREENVDNRAVLERILEAVTEIAEERATPILFPVHPRTEKRMREWNMSRFHSSKRIRFIEPLAYLAFLHHLSSAVLVLTDSGGVQEESCILGIPCITLRDSTERQETVEIGANRVAGTNRTGIIDACRDLDSWIGRTWPNPYGDGQTAKRIVDACLTGAPADEWLH